MLQVYSVVIKLVPCAALTILSLRLIFALLETKRRRQQLSMGGSVHQALNGGAAGGGKRKGSRRANKSQRLVEKEKQTDRTTKMLLAVLLLFLITEAPQGLLGLLSVLLGNQFFQECYVKLGDVSSRENFITALSLSPLTEKAFDPIRRARHSPRWRGGSRPRGLRRTSRLSGTRGATRDIGRVPEISRDLPPAGVVCWLFLPPFPAGVPSSLLSSRDSRESRGLVLPRTGRAMQMLMTHGPSPAPRDSSRPFK